MSYKVSFYTLAKMSDGRIGNIRQSSDVCYTDIEIEEIPSMLDRALEPKKRVAVIQEIKKVDGFVLVPNKESEVQP